MKTPLLDLVPGLAVAATIFRSPASMDADDRTNDTTEADDAPRERRSPAKARQDCKPP